MSEGVEIARLGAQGDGVVEGAAGTEHVAGALPGERWQLGAAPRLVGPPSPSRRASPLCPHFPRCGGCTVQHMDDALYRAWKGSLLAQALAQRGLTHPTEQMQMVPPASRRRATLTARRRRGSVALGYHGPGSHEVEPLTACAVLVPAIVTALPALAALAARLPGGDGEVRLAVLAADNGLDLAIEGVPAKLSATHRAALADLARPARVIRLTVDGDPVVMAAAPVVTINGVALTPPPAAFLQAASAAEQLIADAVLAGLGKAKRVVDLFAGLGTITFAIARKAQVLAVDGDAKLLGALDAGRRHAQGLKPIQTLTRDLFRLPLSPRELKGFDAVVLDPPRAGAKAQVEALARAEVRRIVMVSCNPATLARDLKTLIDAGWRLERALPIDQFLHTPHLEAVAVLTR